MTIFALVFLFLLTAVYNWNAILYERRDADFAAKAISIVILFCIVLFGNQRGQLDLMQGFFLAALAISLVADVLKTLPQRRYFHAGVVVFLLVHLLYIIGMTLTFPTFWARLLVVPIAVLGAVQVFIIRRGAVKKQLPSMVKPIAIYGVVLSLFLFAGMAGLFHADWLYSWNWIKYLTLAIGCSLVYLSDSLLGYGLFCSEERSAVNKIWVILLYHLGQLFLALGCIADVSGLY
ncbi:MAG: lysoplasmalogenase family protein [Bacillota bacterium]